MSTSIWKDFREEFQRSLIEANCLLDLFASMGYAEGMLQPAEVVEKLKANLKSDIATVEFLGKELDGLREVADRIIGLGIELDEARIRIIRVMAMIEDKKTRAMLLKNPAFKDDWEALQATTSKYSRSKTVSLRSSATEFLRVVGESKVGDIVSFLQSIGVDYAKRQTVEGVIRNHPHDFIVTKRGREKFISLAPLA
jgi:hypothetical protein